MKTTRLSKPELDALAEIERARKDWHKEVCLSRGIDPAKRYSVEQVQPGVWALVEVEIPVPPVPVETDAKKASEGGTLAKHEE